MKDNLIELCCEIREFENTTKRKPNLFMNEDTLYALASMNKNYSDKINDKLVEEFGITIFQDDCLESGEIEIR